MKRHLHIVAIAAIAGSLAAGAMQSLFSAWAVQHEIIPPTSGIYTGPAYSQLLGNAFRSIVSCNKGPTAPANVGGDVVDGLCWIDDSVTPWIQKRYVNGGWAVEGALNPTDSSFAGVIGGGLSSLASGSTVDLGSVPEANVTITGSTTITSFGSSAKTGVVKIIRFAGELTLTYSSALPVPTGGYPLVTAANDRAIVTHLGSGNWEFTQYTRASGIPIDVSAVGEIKFGMWSTVPALYTPAYGQALTRTGFPAYVAKVTRAQNGTRTSGNATITSVANTAGLGGGMPVEGTGIGSGCTIASFVANTSITLNSSACVTSSGTSTVTVFLTGYGNGGTPSTIGAPDCRGRTLVGIPELSGVLSSTYFGNNPGALNTLGGSQSHTLTLAQVPTGITSANASQAINTVTQAIVVKSGGVIITAGPGPGSTIDGVQPGTGTIGSVTTTGVNSISVTSNNTSGSAHSLMQPSLIAECIVRITP